MRTSSMTSLMLAAGLLTGVSLTADARGRAPEEEPIAYETSVSTTTTSHSGEVGDAAASGHEQMGTRGTSGMGQRGPTGPADYQ